MSAPMAQPGGVVYVTSQPAFGVLPVRVTCPHCNAQVMTETIDTPGLLTWLLCGGLCIFGCWLGCCLIPFCIRDCKNIEHHCPNCKNILGVHQKI